MTKKRSSNFTSTKSRNKLRNFRRMPTIVTAIDEGMTRQQLGKILSKTDANFAKSIEASYVIFHRNSTMKLKSAKYATKMITNRS